VSKLPRPARLPDIYYIILDAYGRSDILRSLYACDNRDFVNFLRNKGFFVADRSTANYCMTHLSLFSSLNGSYIAPGVAGFPSLGQNAVFAALKPWGYRVISFTTHFAPTDFRDADVYLAPGASLLPPRSSFHALLLHKTALQAVGGDWLGWDTRGEPLDGYGQVRQLANHIFDNLGKVARERSPKFVFAHVGVPHPPFVFGENGEDTSPREKGYLAADGSFYFQVYGQTIADYVHGYHQQVAYVSRRAQQAIDAILESSPEPPIIILQGDHGPGSGWNCSSADPEQTNLKERLSILNAYYFPDGQDKGLYETITPVNSFRILFNSYFQANLDLLPDENFLSAVQSAYEFVNVTDRFKK
jgi:hypothetical protein